MLRASRRLAPDEHMSETLPYCGLPPLPGELLHRFNLDPVLIAVLALLAGAHIRSVRSRLGRVRATAGWVVACCALISPLCALSVSLFSVRVAQHMILVLLAAPLIATGWTETRRNPARLWAAAAAFFIALWFWHMPVPYDATFTSSTLYWAMHVTLFGSAILLWHELINHRCDRIGDVLAAGAATSMQMGLLGAILTFATHPIFLWHLTTSNAWGLTPLQDQQLGGVIMWVPGIALFLWTALRSLRRAWTSLERVETA
jgi:putative membrane protein